MEKNLSTHSVHAPVVVFPWTVAAYPNPALQFTQSVLLEHSAHPMEQLVHEAVSPRENWLERHFWHTIEDPLLYP